MFELDWARLFMPEKPLLELFVRGSVVYIAVFVLLRLVLRRQSGSVSVQDLLVVVFIADAAQNGMADDYQSITDGLILVATLVFWSYALDWLGYHFPPFQRFLYPAPLPLVRDGRPIQRNMRKELVTEGELTSQMRQQGIDDLAQVKEAYMEGNGQMSFLTGEGQGRPVPDEPLVEPPR